MSKASSGYFSGTLGSNNWNTSEVWRYLNPTQENYSGTDLPKSFNLKTDDVEIWTHGNATKHIHEAILSLKDNPKLKGTNPKLYTQFILYDYWKSLSRIVKNGVKYNRKLISNNWEIILAPPRKDGYNPVVKHAKFSGLK